MKLKFKVDSLEGLDEATAKLYKKSGDKFILDVDGMDDGGDVTKLKEQVETLLAEKKAEKRRADDAAEQARVAAEDAARKSGDVAAIEKSWQTKYDKREKELLDQNESLTGNINGMLIDNVAVKLANEIGVQGSADLLIPHIKGRLSAEQRDGKFVTVIRDKDGKPSASSLDDLKSEFVSNPAFAPVIVGSKATGGGANGGNQGGGAAAKAVTRAQFGQMSPQQQMDHSKGGGTVTD